MYHLEKHPFNRCIVNESKINTSVQNNVFIKNFETLQQNL